jgi:large subunit ribosomal protein L24
MAKKKTNATRAPKSAIMKGDKVRVIRGNDRDTEGTVLRVVRAKQQVVVEGVNRRKRHTRPTPNNQEGGIISFEAPIHVSNVMLIDPSSGEPTRVKSNKEGTERVGVKSGNSIPRPH